MICTEDLFVPYKGVCALFILSKATFKKKKKKNGEKISQINGSFIDFFVCVHQESCFIYIYKRIYINLGVKKVFIPMDSHPLPFVLKKKRREKAKAE